MELPAIVKADAPIVPDKPCWACKEHHSPHWLWKCFPTNWIGHKDSYIIYAFTTCGRQAHTEPVAIFSSYLMPAKQNEDYMILPKHAGGYVDPGGVVMPLRQALALAGCCPSVREAKALLAQRTAEITLWPAAGTSNMPLFTLEDGKYVFFSGDELQIARQMPKRLEMS